MLIVLGISMIIGGCVLFYGSFENYKEGLTQYAKQELFCGILFTIVGLGLLILNKYFPMGSN